LYDRDNDNLEESAYTTAARVPARILNNSDARLQPPLHTGKK